MKKIKISKNLTKFLKSKKAYSKFVRNINIAEWEKVTTFSCISHTFLWRDTIEGYDYWDELNTEFTLKQND